MAKLPDWVANWKSRFNRPLSNADHLNRWIIDMARDDRSLVMLHNLLVREATGYNIDLDSLSDYLEFLGGKLDSLVKTRFEEVPAL